MVNYIQIFISKMYSKASRKHTNIRVTAENGPVCRLFGINLKFYFGSSSVPKSLFRSCTIIAFNIVSTFYL